MEEKDESLEDIFTKDGSINYEGVCRTAPATQGLLKLKRIIQEYNILSVRCWSCNVIDQLEYLMVSVDVNS